MRLISQGKRRNETHLVATQPEDHMRREDCLTPGGQTKSWERHIPRTKNLTETGKCIRAMLVSEVEKTPEINFMRNFLLRIFYVVWTDVLTRRGCIKSVKWRNGVFNYWRGFQTDKMKWKLNWGQQERALVFGGFNERTERKFRRRQEYRHILTHCYLFTVVTINMPKDTNHCIYTASARSRSDS